MTSDIAAEPLQSDADATVRGGVRRKATALTMENEHTIGGLLSKRAELLSQIERAETELRKLVIAMGYLDATIRLFDPGAISGPAKPDRPPCSRS